MKIKSVVLITLLAIVLFSCEKIKDTVAVDVETELSVDIPLESTGNATSINLKSTNASEPFGGSAEIDLKTNKDVKDYVDGFRSITTSSVLLNFGGLTTDQVIESITIKAEIVDGVSATFYGSNLSVSNIDTQTAPFVNFINTWDITTNTVVKFTTSGTANFKMKAGAVTANISIPSTVKYSPL